MNIETRLSRSIDTGRHHRRIGEILQSDGVLAETDVRRVLAAQSTRKTRFGETAIALRLITKSQLRSALAQQFNYPIATGTSTLSPLLVAAYEPDCTYAEALRTLRSELLLRWFGEQGSMLAVVSTDPDDGASALAANLAISIAQLGERTLLIDLDLRRPAQHTLFGLDSRHGMSDVLDGHVDIEELAIEEPFPQLHVLSAGTHAPNPQELLSRPRFAHTLQVLAARFDAVILDTPPLNGCADAQLIAARAGASLLVARRHRTLVPDLERLRAQITTSGARLLGAVMNE